MIFCGSAYALWLWVAVGVDAVVNKSQGLCCSCTHMCLSTRPLVSRSVVVLILRATGLAMTFDGVVSSFGDATQ